MRDEYEGLDREQMAERLAVAEDVCRMFGWSAVRAESERDKATSQLWGAWSDLAGPDATDPGRYPHLNDEAQFALAVQRDLTRDTTLRRYFGDDYDQGTVGA